MTTLSMRQTAERLGVNLETLDTWTEMFNFPRSLASAVGPQFLATDVGALERALRAGHSVTAAVLGARLQVGDGADLRADAA